MVRCGCALCCSRQMVRADAPYGSTVLYGIADAPYGSTVLYGIQKQRPERFFWQTSLPQRKQISLVNGASAKKSRMF